MPRETPISFFVSFPSLFFPATFHLSLASVLSWIIGCQWPSGLRPWSLLSLVQGPCAAPLLGAPPPTGNHPTTSPHIVFPASNQPRWKHWKTVLEISLVCMISDEYDFSWIWDWSRWKGYLFLFACICRTYQTEVGRNLDVNFKARWSWTLNYNRGEIWELRPNPYLSLCAPT
jgi:hypothetical protein